MKKLKWYPCELHCHTIHSDGDFTVSELIETSKERGLKGICLTDHNTYSGREETKKEKELAILQGIEWTTYFGHMLVLGADRFVEWRDAVPENIDEKMKQVHAAGGLVGIAHPYQLGTPICTGGRWDFKVKDFSLVNYMEIWSEGEPLMNSPNLRARAWWHQLLSEGFRIAPTMGRDWHRKERNKRKGACTYLLCEGDELTSKGVKDAIQKGRTSVSAGPLFYFETDKGETVGDEIEEGERTFKFTVDSERFDAFGFDYEVVPERIVLYTDNLKAAAECKINEEIRTTLNKGYYTAELYGRIGDDENELIAFTAPLYVKEK